MHKSRLVMLHGRLISMCKMYTCLFGFYVGEVQIPRSRHSHFFFQSVNFTTLQIPFQSRL